MFPRKFLPLQCEPRNPLQVVVDRQCVQWHKDKHCRRHLIVSPRTFCGCEMLNEFCFADESEYFNFINSKYEYEKCGLSPCMQCGELYPCKIGDSGLSKKELFQCEACERVALANPQLTQFEICDNYCAILSSPSWRGKFQFFRDKIDYYTDISYQYQRRQVKVDNPDISGATHAHECYPLDEQFKSRNYLVSQFKIAQLYFSEENSFGNWLDVMAIPVPFDQQIISGGVWLHFEGDWLHDILQSSRNTHSCSWYFGTNNNQWRKDIVKALNFDYDMYLFRQQKFVDVLLPYVEYINDLGREVHEYTCEKNEYVHIDLDMDCMDDEKYSCIYFCQRRALWWCSVCAQNELVHVYCLNKAQIKIFNIHIASHSKQ